MRKLNELLFSACFLAASVTSLVPSAQAQDAGATLKFGTSLGYPPFEFLGPDGKMAGFDIDLGNAICEYLKRTCVWEEIDFSGMVPALKARKFDAMLASVAMTEDRMKQVDFTDEVYRSGTRMIARTDSGLTLDPETLNGKRIGVEQGSSNEKFAKKRWAPKGVVVVTYANQDMVYSDLVSGRLDGVLVAGVQAQLGFLSTDRSAGYGFIGEAIKDSTVRDVSAIAVNKGNEGVVSDLNAALAALHANGTYDRIAAKYFPPSLKIYGE
ncbi:MAG: transporter substrate-binding domain-containing protein [Pararhizobium sp.]